MKKELLCSMIQDLIPNYIEKLTSDNTNAVIEEHLDTCEECRKTYEQMAADIGSLEKVPLIELKFLKKVKKTRILAALLCFVLTIILSYLIYAMEYQFSNDKGNLSSAITEYTSPFRYPVDAYVLETKEIDGVLVASYKDQSNEDVYGFAVFVKGFNQRYRIVRARIESSDYSAVSQMYPVEIGNDRYYAVSGYNLSDEIMYYGLDYDYYTNPGYLSKDRVSKAVKFNVKNHQFLELFNAEEMDTLVEEGYDEVIYNPHLTRTISFYDAKGEEITENFLNEEGGGNQKSSGIGKAELFMVYVFIAIVMGVGITITRYFLST